MTKRMQSVFPTYWKALNTENDTGRDSAGDRMKEGWELLVSNTARRNGMR